MSPARESRRAAGRRGARAAAARRAPARAGGMATIMMAVMASHAAIGARAAAAPIISTWDAVPVFTPSCINGIFEGTEQDPSRTFGCDAGPEVPAAFSHPPTPTDNLPSYTKDSRRDHHHVVDGPLLGNGNVGVVVGGGNLWNVSRPWIDLFISTNSFWALTGANHTTGSPFRGRLALPATMQMGVARVSLPPELFGDAAFSAEQNIDAATVRVNLTSPTSNAAVSIKIFVSPLAPLIWTTISSVGSTMPVAVVLNTTVLPHFYHRDAHINTSFPVKTSARCAAGVAAVTRASDFASSHEAVIGSIQHAVLPSASNITTQQTIDCSVSRETSASLSFTVASETPISVVTAVRTSRDPACVARPTEHGQAKLCNLDAEPLEAGAKILQDATTISLAEATAEHVASWQHFWNLSRISLPQAPETERFWHGAKYILNSAIPHEGQEPTPPGLYGPWGTIDDPGWHGDYTIDYNYEAIFYGVMSSNLHELMNSYPNPMLASMPLARKYAAEKAQIALNISCPGLHFPDVLAPWGASESADGVNSDAGLNSNGPFSTMPVIWEWEYGDRSNVTRVREKLFPLVKGEVDFFTCWLQLNETTGYYHDLHDCTSESAGLCAGLDSTMTLSMARRSFDVVAEMAEFVGEPINPKWAEVRSKLAPYVSGWMHLEPPGTAMASNTSHLCSFCGPFRYDISGSSGDCQATSGRVVQIENCTVSKDGICPEGTAKCNAHVVGDSGLIVDGRIHSGVPSGGNSHSIFPAFPADVVGINDSEWTTPMANTVFHASGTSFSQGNAWTKIYSAAARLTGPGLLKAEDTYKAWVSNLNAQQQPNFIPFNPFSGFETVGALEFVNFMLLQSDPSGFLGLFGAWPQSMDASFERLRGRGAFIVSSSFAKGVVGPTTIVSERGVDCVMRRPESWPKTSVYVATYMGKKVTMSWQGDDFFLFKTVPGGVYKLSIGKPLVGIPDASTSLSG